MLCNLKVTGVGINTEWGLLMASISEDNGEETPLQVFLPSLSLVLCFSGFLFNKEKIGLPHKCMYGWPIIGTVEWGCNVCRHSWAFSSSLCAHYPFGQVNVISLTSQSYCVSTNHLIFQYSIKLPDIFRGTRKMMMERFSLRGGRPVSVMQLMEP